MKEHFLIYRRLKRYIIYFPRIPSTYYPPTPPPPLLISTSVHECLALTLREGSQGEKARVRPAAAFPAEVSYHVGRDNLVRETRREDWIRVRCRVERKRGQASNRWKELRNPEEKRNEKKQSNKITKRPPLRHTQLPVPCVPAAFSWVYSDRDVRLTAHPHLVPKSRIAEL
jgi:hypothetical protein